MGQAPTWFHFGQTTKEQQVDARILQKRPGTLCFWSCFWCQQMTASTLHSTTSASAVLELCVSFQSRKLQMTVGVWLHGLPSSQFPSNCFPYAAHMQTIKRCSVLRLCAHNGTWKWQFFAMIVPELESRRRLPSYWGCWAFWLQNTFTKKENVAKYCPLVVLEAEFGKRLKGCVVWCSGGRMCCGPFVYSCVRSSHLSLWIMPVDKPNQFTSCFIWSLPGFLHLELLSHICLSCDAICQLIWLLLRGSTLDCCTCSCSLEEPWAGCWLHWLIARREKKPSAFELVQWEANDCKSTVSSYWDVRRWNFNEFALWDVSQSKVSSLFWRKTQVFEGRKTRRSAVVVVVVLKQVNVGKLSCCTSVQLFPRCWGTLCLQFIKVWFSSALHVSLPASCIWRLSPLLIDFQHTW